MASTPVDARVDGDTITLGSAISFSGKYSTNGVHASNGYNLAVKMINAAGGVMVGGKSYKLKIKYYDDESTPLRTAQLGERLIKQDKIQFLLGPYSSATTKAMAPITEKYNIPMVEAEGAARSLFTQGYKNLFAVLSTSEQYLAPVIDVAAAIAKKAGKDPSKIKVAMAFENDPFSLDVRAGVVTAAKKYGMNIVIDDKLPRDLSDMSSTLTKVRALKPDVLVVSGHSKGAATAARQIKELKINVPMIAMTHCEAAKVIKKFGASTNGFLCPTQWGETLSYKDKLFGSAAEYDKLFKSTYDGYKNVPYQAAQASAAVMVWKAAFEKANSFNVDKVRAALASTDMKTFYGAIKFSKAGNNIAKPMVLRQIQNGNLKIVAPLKWASDSVQHPRMVGK
ncbi:MAG: amino acid ABC transporter substrate-binding protein [Rhodospirillaceae bacterium]|jgi:branched-chain amino acid transport system substrate-binding protein|nr:amino acid ABC transporter substrate-binding protein [Rhodospirillaceae bacterium]MBT3885973.1 amino acid ABC transporter substrate-binding protein [Rhodospirillaceae bacterium]MBT4115893.1 amino acid ABC transporter substrate-binding protein [Rhodospirillaceae bacterium]MBT4672603.1 amino acid ABC transporter substrate-binding protein [Rhodospirillaceae bacterium]MBT4720749.1 amino acid ABC transporter substrate-binding protein [Rhodospirillaceae bacterium]